MSSILLGVLNLLSGFGALAIGITLLFELGFSIGHTLQSLFATIHYSLYLYFFFDVFCRIFLRNRIRYFLTHPTDLFILAPLIANIIPQISSSLFLLISQISLLLIMVGRVGHIAVLFQRLKLSPPQLVVFGFGFTILIGTLFLSLPIVSRTGLAIPLIDALFTATSAVCVTGLVTIDVGNTFNFFGQLMLLILIQLGGLGIMSFSAFMGLFLNKKFSQRQGQEFQERFASENLKESFQIIRAIFGFTLLFEGLGAFFLYMNWRGDFSSPMETLFYSVFHSVSAFCNAGFSLFGDSLEHYATSLPIISTIGGLVIVGGLGFPVIFNLTRRFIAKQRGDFSPLKLQTKIAIRLTLILLFIGTLLIFFTDYSHAFKHHSLSDKFLLSFFQSISARTAGFNTIDISLLSPSTLIGIMLLMFIGACPGSTAGGIKVTTVGIVFATFWSNLRYRDRTEMFGRTITQANILRALTIMILSTVIVFAFFYALLMVENQPFIALLFETISAFGTVGLSLGITADLSNFGKLFIMLLMLIGRVGPLTVGFALAETKPKPNYQYPEEHVLIA